MRFPLYLLHKTKADRRAALETDIIAQNSIYLIESALSNKPYIDTERTSYAFTNADDAENYAEGIEDVRVKSPQKYTSFDLCSLCYAAGADAIMIDLEQKLIITRQMRAQHPYNHTLNGELALIKQTGDKQHLLNMKRCVFLVPVRIEHRPSVKIKYGIAKHKQNTVPPLYLAFSDLDEYRVWASENHDWDPIKVDFAALYRIASRRGVMINPTGNRIVITPKMLSDIKIHEVK